jgi:hypothetical protein
MLGTPGQRSRRTNPVNAIRPLPSAPFRVAEEFSFAALEQRARRDLVALGGVVAAVLACVALSLRGFEAGSGATPVGDATATSVAELASAPKSAPEAGAVRREAALEAKRLAPDEAEAFDPSPQLARSVRSAQPREEWKESDFYAEFRSLEGEAAFAAAVEAALDGSRPAAECFAALRASYDLRGEASAEHFVRAASELARQHRAGHASLPRTSVHWLAKRAPSEPAARAVLETLAFEPRIEADVRAAGAFALMMATPHEDLERLERRFDRERDEQVLASASSALRARRSTESDAPRDEADEPRE